MAIVFFGSSELSLASLRACIDSGIPVSKVVTTPDAQKGRGLKNLPTPVKVFCQEKRIPVMAPEKLKDPAALDEARAAAPDYFVVASYGKMIPDSWLALPKKLSINVHPSLLPKYRGAAPIQWPILNGDEFTALSLAEVTAKLDAGDIFAQEKFPLPADMNAVELTKKLEAMSYDVLKALLEKLKNGGTVSRTPQNDAQSCYARKLEKEDAWINWNDSAQKIHNQIRGLVQWPVASTRFQDITLQVLKSKIDPTVPSKEGQPGEIMEIAKDGTLRVQTGCGLLKLERVKPAGKNEMAAADFARGKRLEPGARLEISGPPPAPAQS